MAKFLPYVVVIFTILYLVCALNSLEENLVSKNDNSPKDSADVASAVSSKNVSSGRIIHPSAWSKEEKRRMEANGRNTDNEDQDLLLFDERFSLLNIKKFFRYITSLLYSVDENNDESWKKATDDMILKMQNLTGNTPLGKSENFMNDEMQNFQQNNAPNKQDIKKQFQNSPFSNTPDKLSVGEKMEDTPNNGSSNSRQSTETPKFKIQNIADTGDNGEMKISPSNNPINEPSNDGNAQESSYNKQPTGKSKLGTQNSNDKDSTENSKNSKKTQIQNPASTDTQDNGETQISPNNGSNKPLNDENIQKSAYQNTFDDKQPAENSKLRKQNSNDKESMDKLENNIETQTRNFNNTDIEHNEQMQNLPFNSASNKPSNDGNAQKYPDNDSSNNKRLTEYPNLDTQNSNDKDSPNNSKNNVKTETQNLNEFNSLNKSATGGEIQNFSNNGNLNEPSANKKMQMLSSNNNVSKSGQPTKNMKNNEQNSMNKDNRNKTAKDTKMRNPPNSNNQLQSISALKSDKPKEDFTETTFKDYDECKTDEVMLDDNKSKYIAKERMEKYEDNDEEENEDEDYTDESDSNENETENDYVNHNTGINENDVKEDDVKDVNENYMNENDVYNDNDNDNKNYYADENKPDTGNQNSQPAVFVQEKTDNTPVTLPKFIIPAMRDQQNYFVSHPPKNQTDTNDNVKPEPIKSQNTTNEENPSPEFQLSSNEFIDDYINNRQGQNPRMVNEQTSNTEIVNPSRNDAINRKNPLPIPVFLNKVKKDYAPIKANPSTSKTVNQQNMPFHQLQNNEDNFRPETNAFPFSNANEDRKSPNHNQDLRDEVLSQNVPYTFTSFDKPVFSTQENVKGEEVTPQKMIPLQQAPYFTDLQDAVAFPQKGYNTFAQPATFGFQDMIPSIKTFHSDVPATNEYWPEIANSFQVLPNKPVPLQNEGYLNDQQGKYKTEEILAVNNENNEKFEKNEPIVLQPGMFLNTQYISNQDNPEEISKTTYFTNYRPEMLVNVQTVEKPETNTEMFSNNIISDVLQSNPPFNRINNQGSLPTDTENNMDRNKSEDQLGAIKPQSQTNNVQILNSQNQSENQPMQDKFPGEQMLFPHNDKSLQQIQTNNRIISDKSKMNSERFPVQDKTDNTKLPLQQKNTKNSKEIPRTEDNLQVKPENQDYPSVITESPESKSQSPQDKLKSSKPLIDERHKSPTFVQAKETSNSGPNSSKNEIKNDYLNENNYDSKDKMNGDKDQNEDEEDDDDDETEDDYVSENNYESNDNMDENEEEEEEEDENEEEEEDENEEEEENEAEDDYENESNYDYDETEINSNDQNPQKAAVINEKTSGSTNRPSNFVNQEKSDQQNDSIIQFPTSHDNRISEDPKSKSMTNNENPSSTFKLRSDGFNDNYNNGRLEDSPIKEKDPMNLSDGTVNDATMQITPNPIYSDTNGITQSSEISKNESISSNQGESFDTILEYIYKFSNNPLFKGLRDKKN